MRRKVWIASQLIVATAIGVVAAASCGAQPSGDRAYVTDEAGGSNSTTTTTGGNPGAGGGSMGTGGTGEMGGGSMMPVTVNDATCSMFTPDRANTLSPVDPGVAPVVTQMSVDQKIAMLSGGPNCPNYDCDFNATGVPGISPAIPDWRMSDGPRGVHVLSGGKSSTWAVAEARAASFDTDLEFRVGKAQGEEMLALKLDVSLAPTINTLRHPAWARAQETYGEDPIIQGELGAAFVRGMQKSVVACPKHFAGNDTDNNRHTVIAKMDEQTLRENYTKPFEIVVQKADPACIMAAYNGINDTVSNATCTENAHLLTDIARTEWKWTGTMISDWWATKQHGATSLNAGLDLEMPDNRAFVQLPQALQMAQIKGTRIDEAATRILNSRMKLGQLTPAYLNQPAKPTITDDPTHQALASETEEKGAVLLKNDKILPLGDKGTALGSTSAAVKSIIFLGPDAAIPTTNVKTANVASGLGDRGSSNTNPPYAVSFLDGLKKRAGAGVTITSSANAADASKAEVVIIPVAMAHEDEGEAFDGGADRVDLTLSGAHPRHWGATKPAAFIKAAAAANPNVIVLLAVGSAIVMEDWMMNAKAIVQTFYPGQEGGNAVAKLLFGDINFSGKLPFTVAQNPTDYPAFQNNIDATTVDYLHGYRKFEKEAKPVRFWFGYGMSYTTYDYSNLKVLCTDGITETGRLNVQVTVKNSGMMAGDEIVQLYIGYPKTAARRPVKELKTFTRVTLMPGESKDVQLSVPAKDMAYWGANGWTVEKVEHAVLVGPSSDPMKLLSAPFTIK
jgi:beta-glucosidase